MSIPQHSHAEPAMSQIVQLISDFSMPIAAFAMVWIAWRGLQAWKEQQVASIRHDLAKRFIAAVIDVRDSIASIRSGSFRSAAQLRAALEDAGEDPSKMAVEEISVKGDEAVYNEQFANFHKMLLHLRDVVREAEVVLGEKYRGFDQPLWNVRGKLFVAARRVLEARRGEGPLVKQGALREKLDQYEDILEGGDPENPYTIEIEETCETLISEFRSHLLTAN